MQFDLAAGQREILVLEERADAFLEMHAPRRKRPGFHREQADLERRALRDRRHWKCGGAGSGGGTGKKLTAIGPVSHGILPELKAVLARPDIWT